MKPGVRVVRGPDWRNEEEDGGIGFLGTIVNTYPNNTVKVRWDIGTETICRAGKEGAFDLRLYDNAPIGSGTKQVFCDGHCLATKQERSIFGLRWKCLVCSDRDNCTACYMSGYCSECLNHPCARYTTPHATVVRVPPRSRSKKISLYGICPGAQVTRLVQNSKEGERIGIVKEVVNLQPDAYRSAVRVEWIGVQPQLNENGEPVYDICMLGADGKVDLKLTEAASPGKVILEHLPVVDLSMPVDIDFNVGDKVRIDQNLDTFMHLQTEYGGWVDNMEKLLGEEGKITAIKDPVRKFASVQFKSGLMAATYMNILTKISTISAGDIVQVIKDENKVKNLQNGHGGWQYTYMLILGETGRVIRIDESKDAIVDIKGVSYILNPNCLVYVSQGDEPVTVSNGMSTQFADSMTKSTRLTLSKIPRTIAKPGMDVDIGARVVRGPDWSPDFEDQDGGEGAVGTIVEICGTQDGDTYPSDCVVVQWDCGGKNVYRAGYQKSYDLRLYDNATIGVKHKIKCSECGIQEIYGFLWECAQCEGVSLCSECYHGDVHDINHQFNRLESLGSKQRTKVPKRAMSKRLQAKGIFEGCRVQRGPDWRWINQDGGEDKFGDVIALVNFSPDTDRDAAEVTWGNGYTNVYRLGYHGRLDIVCTELKKGPLYYRDHIPTLKLQHSQPTISKEPVVLQPPSPVSVAQPTTGVTPTPTPTAKTEENNDARFQEGDKVNITIDVDVLKVMVDNRGPWNDRMAECIGKVGTVLMANDNDITVDFQTAGKWTFHESVLNKVRQFVVGEVVKVHDSVDHVKMLQDEVGWNPSMALVVGKKGCILEVDDEGDVKLSFGEYTWIMSPECLSHCDGQADHVKFMDESQQAIAAAASRSEHRPVSEPADQEADLLSKIEAGNVDAVQKILNKEPQLLLMDLKGTFAIHKAAECGQVTMILNMFKTATKDSLLEYADSENITPLLAAVRCGQVASVEYLVDEGANKGAVNCNQQGAVHLAVAAKNKNKLEMLKTLRRLRFDVNQKDALKQTPIFDVILNGTDDEVDVILDWPSLDIDFEDSIGFSPFFIACRAGCLPAVQRILELCPKEIEEKKQTDGFTGLHIAAMNGRTEVVKHLLKVKRLAVDSQALDGQTALHLACSEGLMEIVQLLVDGGADVHIKDYSNRNCLHFCMEETDDVESESEESTAAADTDILEMADFLQERGVLLEKDDSGKLPTDYLNADHQAELLARINGRRTPSPQPTHTPKTETEGPQSLPPNMGSNVGVEGQQLSAPGPMSLRTTASGSGPNGDFQQRQQPFQPVAGKQVPSGPLTPPIVNPQVEPFVQRTVQESPATRIAPPLAGPLIKQGSNILPPASNVGPPASGFPRAAPNEYSNPQPELITQRDGEHRIDTDSYIGGFNERSDLINPPLGGEEDSLKKPLLGGEGDSLKKPLLGGEGDSLKKPLLGGEGDSLKKPLLGGKGSSLIEPPAVGGDVDKANEDFDDAGDKQPLVNIPDVCESCEEEPVRYKMEPCRHYLCADCIPKKKQKIKRCDACDQRAEHIVDIQLQ